MWRGKIFSGSRLWNTELATDLTKKVTRLEIPVYFLHGMYDYTVSYTVAKSYFEQLDAPVKGFYTFERVCAQPLVRGAGEDARDHAGGRADGIQGTCRPPVALGEPLATPGESAPALAGVARRPGSSWGNYLTNEFPRWKLRLSRVSITSGWPG